MTDICRRPTPLQKEALQYLLRLVYTRAEQSLKTGLFYYDEISTPCSARASPAQPKNF